MIAELDGLESNKDVSYFKELKVPSIAVELKMDNIEAGETEQTCLNN